MTEEIKEIFSIGNLEALTGIKPHTIRTWEKRYGILKPSRTTTNIRKYDLDSLNYFLNISYLYHRGYKISKLSKISPDEIAAIIYELVSEQNPNYQAINNFKTAMMSFNHKTASDTYNKLLLQNPIRYVYCEIIFPLFSEISLLQQANNISNAQYRFLSQFIKQKLSIHIENAQNEKSLKKETFIVFSPINEFYELELLYIHLELLMQGYRSIYLGSNIQEKDLKTVSEYYTSLIFLMGGGETLDKSALSSYISNSDIDSSKSELWIYSKSKDIKNISSKDSICFFNSIKAVLNAMK